MFRGALLALTALALSACVPAGQSQADEEREPYFMAGKKRNSTLDYSGAMECFEKALEVNPRSGAAHFELACLFDTNESDPAAAIYHYQSYLKLRPDAGNSYVVKQRIAACKDRLAQEVKLGPLTEKQQRELEQLGEENKRLNAEVKRLNEDLEKWRAYAAQLAGTRNSAGAPTPAAPPRASAGGSTNSVLLSTLSQGGESATPAVKTHTIKPGDTPTSIARKYGLKVEALLAANPKVDARRLRVGQPLVIPVP